MQVCERGRECGSGVSSECGSGVRVWREQDIDVGVDVGVVWAWRCVDMGVWRGGGCECGWRVSGCEWVRRRAERGL